MAASERRLITGLEEGLQIVGGGSGEGDARGIGRNEQIERVSDRDVSECKIRTLGRCRSSSKRFETFVAEGEGWIHFRTRLRHRVDWGGELVSVVSGAFLYSSNDSLADQRKSEESVGLKQEL